MALADLADLVEPPPAPPELGDGRQDDGDLPDEAYVVGLTTLDLMGPRRLAALLDVAAPRDAWSAVAGDRVLAHADDRLRRALGSDPTTILRSWARQAERTSLPALWQRHVEAGLGVALRGAASFPTGFVDDPEPPAIIFSRGDPDVVVGPRVAIVGTRDCTRTGHDTAVHLGAALAEAGVAVVSGLALGIDGAAHTGALSRDGAPPIAIVGSGLDVVYPRRHADLWRRVGERGVVLSEYPLGSQPTSWHFPARNRLIVALADVVVVVESQLRGGSMHTVEAAIERNVPLMAVPGPVTSRVSAGTNKLLFEGADVCRDADDVLVALGLSPGARRAAAELRPPPTPEDRDVLEAFEWQPATFDHLVLRTGFGLFELTVALDRLIDAGWVDRRGGWYERIAKPGG